jgi:ketosteroid isomerase-like protein
VKLFDDFEAAWGSGDQRAFATVCAPDVHYEDPLTRDPLDGPAAIGAHAQRLWLGFQPRHGSAGERALMMLRGFGLNRRP